MDPVVQEWLHLVIRWIHVIVGIAWIGTSFFFMWLDAHLHPPLKEEEGVQGEAWLLHSGGFYRMSKKQLAPDQKCCHNGARDVDGHAFGERIGGYQQRNSGGEEQQEETITGDSPGGHDWHHGCGAPAPVV